MLRIENPLHRLTHQRIHQRGGHQHIEQPLENGRRDNSGAVFKGHALEQIGNQNPAAAHKKINPGNPQRFPLGAAQDAGTLLQRCSLRHLLFGTKRVVHCFFTAHAGTPFKETAVTYN
ncbi:hypothetical protein SDC9_110510 [bioreactor metagenome]|uniref:Uncharacterized protein n=1 Tax=bioreactor metagenome TaxID=1076179 RepID=A0A645BDS8_9ZZZZ